MKSKHIITTLALAGLIGTGTFIGIKTGQEYNQVNAAATTGNTTIVVGVNDDIGGTPKDYLNAKGYKAVVWYWGSGIASAWTPVDPIGDRLGTLALPSGVEHFRLLRTPSSTSDTSTYPTTKSDESNDMDYSSSCDMVIVNGWNSAAFASKCSQTIIETGTVFTVNTKLFGNWFAEGAVPYLPTYCDSYYDTWKQWNLMERIGNTEYVRFVTTKPLVIGGMYVTRNNPNAEVVASDAAIWNQSTDITTNLTDGLFELDGTKTGEGKYKWKAGTNSSYAEMWGAYFLTNVTCTGDGAISEANWDAVEAEYHALPSAAQSVVENAVGEKEGTTYLSKGIYRYDYIVLYKKSLDPTGYASYADFLNREDAINKTTVFDATGTLTISNSTSGLMAAVIISSIAIVTLLGAALVIKKRQLSK